MKLSDIEALDPPYPIEKYFKGDPGSAQAVLSNRLMTEPHRLWTVFSVPGAIDPTVVWWFMWWCVWQALLMLKTPNEDILAGFEALANPSKGSELSSDEYRSLYERVGKLTVLMAVSANSKSEEKAAIVYNMALQSSDKKNVLKVAHTLYALKRMEKGRRLRWRGNNPVQKLLEVL